MVLGNEIDKVHYLHTWGGSAGKSLELKSPDFDNIL